MKVSMMEDYYLEGKKGYVVNDDNNIPFPIYQEMVPKLPFPKILVLYISEYKDTKRLGIKNVVAWD